MMPFSSIIRFLGIGVEPLNRCFLEKTLQVFLGLVLWFGLFSCQSNVDNSSTTKSEYLTEDTTALVDLSKELLDKYEIAKEQYLKNTRDPELLIWYGRRTAYLGQFNEAIEIFSTGIQEHPNDARLYRHRGHRYISTRQYDKAIKDLEFAVTLITDKEDQIEPDGLPNERNIPLSTLHGNIWYHLGLAYYLKNDLENALRAFENRTVTERYPDNLVSGGHWLYMILRRMGRNEQANNALNSVTTNMDIIENHSYYKMCLFYRQMINEKDLQPQGSNSASNDVLQYGLGNWYLYHNQDTLRAKKYYQHLLQNGNRYSFAYLAAESDWNRLYGQ